MRIFKIISHKSKEMSATSGLFNPSYPLRRGPTSVSYSTKLFNLLAVNTTYRIPL